MPHEQWCFTRRAVLKGAVAALAGGVSIGCDDDLDFPLTPGTPAIIGSCHIIGNGMYEAFDGLRTSLNEGDRAAIEELIRQGDLLIHVFLATGRLPPDYSRGGASAPASGEFMKQVCDFHPIVGKFAPERNWDVAFDPERTAWFERMHKIPSPPEVVLYHELFGHVIPCLKNPELIGMLAMSKSFREEKECEALDIENRYRRQIKLPEVPRKLIKCSSPKK